MAVAMKGKRTVLQTQGDLERAEAGVDRKQGILEPASATRSAGDEPAATYKPDPIGHSSEQEPFLTNVGTRVIVASLIFDSEWYRQEYPDVVAAGLDPVMHYFDNGSREGRNPNRYFDTNWYASNNPDVAAAGLNPFLHYLLYGAKEGRLPSA